MGVAGVRRVCGVHSRQNGTRCRDGVKVLWYCSYLVWLVFEGSIPTCACFQLKTFLLLVCFVFFLLFGWFCSSVNAAQVERDDARGAGG